MIALVSMLAATSFAAPQGGAVWHPHEFPVDTGLANLCETTPTPDNPFMDYRLNALFTGPSGQQYLVPGFYAGDGASGACGSVWKLRFTPDEAGAWTADLDFQYGIEINVSTDPGTGVPLPGGTQFTFDVAALSADDSDFWKWGRLKMADKRYLKFTDGPYFLGAGVNSPENFFGYAGFDDPGDEGGKPTGGPWWHEFPEHVDDWNPGDPDWDKGTELNQGRGIIGAVNYIADQKLNSMVIMPMTLGGDSRDTFPFIGIGSQDPYLNTHYDVSRMEQWNVVLEHAMRKGIQVQLVLAEAEGKNRRWFDWDQPMLGPQRMLYFKQLIAMFSHHVAIKWNMIEEHNWINKDFVLEQGRYFSSLDPYGSPIGIMDWQDSFGIYIHLKDEPWFVMCSHQWREEVPNGGDLAIRQLDTIMDKPFIFDMDEPYSNEGLTPDKVDFLRKQVMYDVLFSGGNLQWFCGMEHPKPPTGIGDDQSMEDFGTREPMWEQTWFARNLIESRWDFWDMVDADELLTLECVTYGEASVFSKPGETYAVYLPCWSAGTTIDLTETGSRSTMDCQWWNPRTGQDVGAPFTCAGGAPYVLPDPPAELTEDWVLILEKQ